MFFRPQFVRHMDNFPPFLKGLVPPVLELSASERLPFRFRKLFYGLLEFLSQRAGDGCGDEAKP